MKKICVIIGITLVVGLGLMIGFKKDVSFDDVSFDQASQSEIQALSSSVQEIEEQELSEDQIAVFFNLHEDLLEAHEALVQKHQDFKNLRDEIQVTRQNFKSLDVRLNREDGVTLWYYYNDLLDLRDAFKETHGLAYQRLVDLKGSYSIENYDLVIETFEEVLVVLNQRIAILDQGMTLLNQSQSIYLSYMN